MGKSIVQDWATELGLRHQGTLMGAIRGCDASTKNAPEKRITRILRGVVLNAFVGDPRKAKSFIEWCEDWDEFKEAMDGFFDAYDAIPHHFVMHLIHAAEVIGYYHTNPEIASWWLRFYKKAVHKLHLNLETKEQLDARLSSDEQTFALDQ